MAIVKEYKVTSTTPWSELDSDEIGDNNIAKNKTTWTSSVKTELIDDYNKLVTLTFADSAALTNWKNDFSGPKEDYTKSGFSMTISGPSGKLT